jgi:succinate-semialdehyde dehydrogenase/glutarate-semialdehyde dehydrogenase
VLTGITPEMRAYREELFGPVAVVYSVASDEEAFELANDLTTGSVVQRVQHRSRTREKVAQRPSRACPTSTPRPTKARRCRSAASSAAASARAGPLGMDEFCNKRLYFGAD